MEERREYTRVSLVVKVVNRDTKEFHYFYSRDVSQGGMFLDTREPYPVDTEVELDFFIPLRDKKNRIVTRAKVVRSIEHDGKQQSDEVAGMGIVFVDIESEAIGAIARYVREEVNVESGEE